MEKQALKSLLKEIKENNYVVPEGVHPHPLALTMMEYIGDIDSELRDELILANLFTWINEGVLSTSEVYELFKIALDEEHLLKGLGDVSDFVFCRTFSVEVLAGIIYRHRKENFLSKEDLQKALHTVLKFYTEDQDVRGYVAGKGWAHGAAHGADVLDELARCEEIQYEELKKILNAIHKKVNIHHYGYIHFEDERMITAVQAVLERKIISNKEMEEWIRSFSKIEKLGTYPEDLVIEFNITMFLKSLYFRIIDQVAYETIAKVVKEVFQEVSRFSKY